jgi:hypothetical protein
MINYRVDDLDALLEAPRAEGVEIDPKYGEHRFRDEARTQRTSLRDAG